MENEITYIGRNHTYTFYKKKTIKNGFKYRRGYYDEYNQYYKNVVFTNKNSYITCYNCKSGFYDRIKYNQSAYCPYCGEEIRINAFDTLVKEAPKEAPKYLIGVSLALGLVTLILIIAFAFYVKVIEPRTNTAKTDVYAKNVTTESAFIYVDELQRDVEKIGYNSYYDAETECFFKFNNDAIPTQWYYYYKGISDNFEGYGWMVYNNYLNVWQINIGNKQWKTLESEYVTDRLWHFTAVCRNNVEATKE